MLDLKVYLQRKKVKLEPLFYFVTGSCFLLKAYFISFNHLNFWFGLNIFLGTLLLGFMVWQIITRFKHPKLADYFSSRIGLVLVGASLIKLYGAVTEAQLAFLVVGLLFMFTSTLEEILNKISFVTLDDEGILVRQSITQTVCYSWHEIADLDIKRARIKLILHSGDTIYLRVAREYTNSCMLRTAQYYGEKLQEITRESALMVA